MVITLPNVSLGGWITSSIDLFLYALMWFRRGVEDSLLTLMFRVITLPNVSIDLFLYALMWFRRGVEDSLLTLMFRVITLPNVSLGGWITSSIDFLNNGEKYMEMAGNG